MTKKNVKALCLFSGGLDSLLAVCLMQKQGITVDGIVFTSTFFDLQPALKGAKQLGIDLVQKDFTEDIIGLIKAPPHGFGKGLNPCIDCHALMFKNAGEYMQENGYDFLCTGEVLNERPMSQNKKSLHTVATDSSFGEFLLRPLSAQILPPTKMETEGLVDREQLEGIQGRGRKRQMALAEEFGLKTYPSPAGGCKLTEPSFAKRMKDLKSHEGVDNLKNIDFLKVGRHFRLNDGIKLIVGRNRSDNEYIINNLNKNDNYVLHAANVKGPFASLSKDSSQETLQIAAAICARYSDSENDELTTIRIKLLEDEKLIEVLPMKQDEINALLL
jgi:tRNA U34 2-thiouridine synthase MnmA/TrmU